ncbi:MAG TPA: nitronate monooxygenase [Thermomicrobiales bacterium]|nr:nitronate monooxygenase [Thermomicrobiales bacterium]
MVSTRTLHTPLCDVLGIRYPIIQAPMAGSTTPELVAAVSNAGGLGMLGAGWMDADQLREAIDAIKERTEQPFGVNFLLINLEPGEHDPATVQPFLNRYREELGLPPGSNELPERTPQTREMLEVVAAERVPVVGFAMKDPSSLIGPLKEAGATVFAMVTSVAEAEQVVAGGVDVVVAQGAEAGGHQSTFNVGPDDELPLVGTLSLVPQVVDAVSVPVVAAGGIMDGRGVVAALALGAQGAQMGTRFLSARESGVSPANRERLLAAIETDIMLTRAYSGRPARGIRNHFLETYHRDGPEPLSYPLHHAATSDIFREAASRDDADYFPLMAGQGVRLIRQSQGAMEIVEELVAEAESVISRLAL